MTLQRKFSKRFFLVKKTHELRVLGLLVHQAHWRLLTIVHYTNPRTHSLTQSLTNNLCKPTLQLACLDIPPMRNRLNIGAITALVSVTTIWKNSSISGSTFGKIGSFKIIKMMPFDRSHTTSYSPSTANIICIAYVMQYWQNKGVERRISMAKRHMEFITHLCCHLLNDGVKLHLQNLE